MKPLAFETMCNIDLYLNQKNYPVVARKQGESSSEGYIYELPGCGLVDVRVDSDVEYLIFHVYPGITLADKAFFPMTATYCQKCSLPVGVLKVSPEFGNVFFHAESAMKEHAVTGKTLEMLEAAARYAFQTHGQALEEVANGILSEKLNFRQPDENSLPDAMPDLESKKLFDATANAIDAHLSTKSGHNCIARSVDSTEALWLCEVLSGKRRFFMKVKMNSLTGFMTVQMYPGVRGLMVKTPYRQMTSTYCESQNYNKKIGTIRVGDEENGLHASAAVSLRDGAVGGRTVEDLERILFSMLHMDFRNLAMVSHGMLPASDGGGQKMEQMMKMFSDLERLISSGDDDEAGSDPEPSGESFADLDVFLAANA